MTTRPRPSRAGSPVPRASAHAARGQRQHHQDAPSRRRSGDVWGARRCGRTGARSAPAARARMNDEDAMGDSQGDRQRQQDRRRNVAASAMKKRPTRPSSHASGRKTIAVVAVVPTRAGSERASTRAPPQARRRVEAAARGLDDHDGVVDHQADGHGQTAHRHEVQAGPAARRDERDPQRHGTARAATSRRESRRNSDDGHASACRSGWRRARSQRFVDQLRLIVDGGHLDAGREGPRRPRRRGCARRRRVCWRPEAGSRSRARSRRRAPRRAAGGPPRPRRRSRSRTAAPGCRRRRRRPAARRRRRRSSLLPTR